MHSEKTEDPISRISIFTLTVFLIKNLRKAYTQQHSVERGNQRLCESILGGKPTAAAQYAPD